MLFLYSDVSPIWPIYVAPRDFYVATNQQMVVELSDSEIPALASQWGKFQTDLC